jgi:DNA primase
MPGIDFRAVKDQISMREVLGLVCFAPNEVTDHGLRGPCPIHRSASVKSRSLAVHLEGKMYRCFKCGSAGNHLDLYAAVTHQSVFQAAVELCTKLNYPIPWRAPTRNCPGL